MKLNIQLFGGRGASSSTNVFKNKIKTDLKNGMTYTIGGKKDYTPTSFRYEKRAVYYKNADITGNEWAKHPNNLAEILNHFERMKKERFSIRKTKRGK